MRASSYGIAVAIVLLLSMTVRAAAVESGSDVWRHDFDQAEAEAKRRGLPMLVHFHAKWCAPCRQMERDVLNDPVLLKQLRAGFIAVKVDGDERADLVGRFHVDSYPSDVFLDPNGYVLDRSNGGRDRQSYLSQVARIDARFAQSRKSQIAAQERSSATEPIAAHPPAARVTAPSPTATGPSPSIRPRPHVVQSQTPRWRVGLRGFSPVALVAGKKWVPGDVKLAAEYKGIVYHMASVEERKRFLETPDRYAPQVLGCDPVILDVTDRAVAGDIHFAAFFEGELYLFVSDKSRSTFKQDPERYVRTKHVLKVDELDDTRWQ